MNTMKKSAEDVLREAPKEIWLRFYATHNQPQGSQIPVVDRDDQKVEARQRQEAVDQGVDPDRLQRPGDKPDSGRQIVRDVRFSCVRKMLADLELSGYRLVKAFVNRTRRTDRPGMKTVYTFVFSTEGEALTLSPIDQQWFDRCMSGTYDHLAIFKNPKRESSDGDFSWRQDTVNIRGLKPMKAEKFTRMASAGVYSHDQVA